MKKTFKFGRINKKEGINAFHQTVSSERTGTFPDTSQKMPDGSAGKESTCNAGDIGDMGSIPGLGSSMEKEKATHSSTLAQKIPWMEEPGVHGVAKSWTRLSDFTFTFILAIIHMRTTWDFQLAAKKLKYYSS